jgi:hypothetical protein
MMYLMHLNDFYEFGSIEPNSKKHRNIEKIRFGSIELIRLNSIRFDSVRFGSVRFGSVRFGSIFQESSRVSLYTSLITYMGAISLKNTQPSLRFCRFGKFLIIG